MIKSFSVDEITKSFIQIANEAIESRGRFLVSLAGGSTPMKLYEKFADVKLDWTRVHFFWGDERCVPMDDDGNSFGQTKKILFDKIGATNIHRVNTDLDIDSATEDYLHTLSLFASPPLNFPRFDLVILGLGEDGHTASLFPNSIVDVNESVIAVTAHYQDRPANRVTLTQKVFNEAKEIWFLVTGKNKAEILNTVINGEKKLELYPAQRIQPTNGNLVWWVDEEAGNLINKSMVE
ncbi:MAG: 6-phosphogluconolactonase [Anaerolineales bacterium]|nr:6-phosphogluconolactonase [Anaerolineales bacterium]